MTKYNYKYKKFVCLDLQYGMHSLTAGIFYNMHSFTVCIHLCMDHSVKECFNQRLAGKRKYSSSYRHSSNINGIFSCCIERIKTANVIRGIWIVDTCSPYHNGEQSWYF